MVLEEGHNGKLTMKGAPMLNIRKRQILRFMVYFWLEVIP